VRSKIGAGVIALLAGFCAFGFYQCMVLLHKNNDLSGQMDRLQIELAAAQVSLNKTQVLLGESYLKNAQLDNDRIFLRRRLARVQQQLTEEKQRIMNLAGHLLDTRKTNEVLYSRNAEMSEKNLRLSFENQEMKKTLSSVSELKKAIASLRKQAKRHVVARSAPKSRPKPQPQRKRVPVRPSPQDAYLDGNQGFLLKDGRSTFADLVDIRVIPVE